MHLRLHQARFLWIALLSLLPNIAGGSDTDTAASRTEDQSCLRCHGMASLSYRDPSSGVRHDFHVDETRFAASVHGKQPCQRCHGDGFEHFPHRQASNSDPSSCADCHTSRRFSTRMRLSGITAQFTKSVHVQRKVAGFDCFSCHDPHVSRLEDRREPARDVVARDNGVCLNCHAGMLPMAKSHGQAIPKAKLHGEAVRCIECHTPRPGSVIHAIEPADRAERTCSSCHSRDSILLTKLYKYRLHESERRAGFINGVVLGEHYIIGMTRHPLLDGLGIFAVAGTFAGVVAHGAGRWLAARRRRDHEK